MQKRHISISDVHTNVSVSGTGAVFDGEKTRGHVDQTLPVSGTNSGNFDTVPSSKGHCTGAGSVSCAP
jgi:hypothetical protein